MEGQRREEAEGVFASWLARREQERGRSLEELEAGHPPLVSELRRLHADWLWAQSKLAGVAPSEVAGASLVNALGLPSDFGRFRVLAELGRGGMGVVYLAVERETGRKVALKVMGPKTLYDPRAVERFQREGKLAAGIDHPRCVFVLETGELEGQPYIAMDYVPGGTLEERVRRDGPLEPEQAIRAILDVIDGLIHAHLLGVVHRDIKPSNCFLDEDGRVQVGDFGLSRSLAGESKLTQTGSGLGTPLFSAPEQLKGEDVAVQADVYSVAATLYFLLTGAPPLEGKDEVEVLARVLTRAPAPPSSRRPGIPRELDRVVLRALEKEPAKRWRDLIELRPRLLRLLPERLEAVGMALRFPAYLIDGALFLIVHFLLKSFGLPCTGDEELWQALIPGGGVPGAVLRESLLFSSYFVYYTLTEGLWGASIGKLVLGLRVVEARGLKPPGILRSALRASVALLVIDWGGASLGGYLSNLGPSWSGSLELVLVGSMTASYSWMVVAHLATSSLLGISMRRSNGFRGLHEFLSRTRTIRLHRLPAREQPRHQRTEAGAATTSSGRIGPYLVTGTIQGDPRPTFEARDELLGRDVWIRAKVADAPPQREERTARLTRQRTLGTLKHGGRDWDVLLAPRGRRLCCAIEQDGPWGWNATRSALVALCLELERAEVRPEQLRLESVWARPDGGVLITEFPSACPRHASAAEREGERVLLRDVASLCLLGNAGRGVDPVDSVPVPGRGGRILRALWTEDGALKGLADLRRELALSEEVTLLHRAKLTGVRSLVLLPILSAVLSVSVVHQQWIDEELAGLASAADQAIAQDAADPDTLVRLEALNEELRLHGQRARSLDGGFGEEDWTWEVVVAALPQIESSLRRGAYEGFVLREDPSSQATPSLAAVLSRLSGTLSWAFPLAMVLLAGAVRRSPFMRWVGVRLVDARGREAPRWRLSLCAFFLWAPLAALLQLNYWLATTLSEHARWSVPASGVIIVVALGYPLLALRFPRATPHERLAGLVLVTA